VKRTSTLLQLLSHVTNYQPDPEHISDELERLKVFVPGVSHNDSRDLLMVALAYVEHFRGDVLQLEHEKEFLCVALSQAWQQEKYDLVVRLVRELTQIAGRLNDLTEAEQILHLGIEACRRTQDRQHLVYFLNRLGALLFSHGKYQQGRRIWRTSLRLAGSTKSSSDLWEPFTSFTQIADILGNYTEAQQFVETLLSAHNSEDQDGFVVALFIRGLYARLMNSLDRAYEDFSYCLRLLSLQANDAHHPADRQIFTMAVQAELARVQGNYARSQQYTETALSLAQIFSDRYTVASLLIDQGLYTYRQGQYADTYTTFQRLRNIACQMEAPHVYECSRFLGRHLAQLSPECYNGTPERQEPLALATSPVTLHEALSDREVEVLLLVAEGLSNQEVARRLVISKGTVKKHLEHIYTKLDVHCRTSAIARARKHQLLA
jgi:ATP/maltotriose-dependent transcriptional regulator MalT